jgi:hypothetical protein
VGRLSILIKAINIPIRQASQVLTVKIILESTKLKIASSRKLPRIKNKKETGTSNSRTSKKLTQILAVEANKRYTANFQKAIVLSFRDSAYATTRTKALINAQP